MRALALGHSRELLCGRGMSFSPFEEPPGGARDLHRDVNGEPNEECVSGSVTPIPFVGGVQNQSYPANILYIIWWIHIY